MFIKLVVNHALRWFGHIQRRPAEAPVYRGVLRQDINVREVEENRSSHGGRQLKEI